MRGDESDVPPRHKDLMNALLEIDLIFIRCVAPLLNVSSISGITLLTWGMRK